ncbi:hypothetical protein [uncultured Streptococcus sp.]|jgi:hypothetical protein|uniref:hypothetical protein n=1 Tax=uncultured Streptococcus sp. TaxID=83427 RepID=UPI0025EF4639|nr:hypothetical protein [uncultured Streptococcus sp.]
MKSQVMTLAWKIFRNEKNDVTFSTALKFAWKTVKRQHMADDFYFFRSSNVKFQGVKKWFAEKEFHGRNKKDLAFMSVTAISVKDLVEETEKAVKLEIVTPYGISTKWYPKSVLA